MSSSSGPRIVTNSLVFHVDAADIKSYSKSGTVWNDRSGKKNNGTLVNGVGYHSGNGGSLVFNGANNRGVQVAGTNLSLNQMTISSWNYSTNYNQNGFMFEKTTNGAVDTQYSLFYNGNNTIYYRTKGLSTEDLGVNTTLAGVINNQWNNIVATFDGVNKKIYVNGIVKQISATLTNTITQNTTGPAYIGVYGNFGGYFFNGKIAQTHIHNRALSSQEIIENFDTTKSKFNLL